MLWPIRKRWLPALLAVGLFCAGCELWNRTAGDEEREPHYVQGLNWQIQGQTDKAIESFTRALNTNPNSAAAHLSLGDLHYKLTKNFIVAAYHYSEFLRIKTARQSGFRDQGVEDLIKSCELTIAAKYANAIARQENQIALESLRLENSGLREENRLLKRAAGIESLRITATNPPTVLGRTNSPSPVPRGPVVPLTPPVKGPAPTPPEPRTAPTARTHKVAAGEIPSTIARRYGVTVKALMAANPTVRANQLRVGQMLTVPAP